MKNNLLDIWAQNHALQGQEVVFCGFLQKKLAVLCKMQSAGNEVLFADGGKMGLESEKFTKKERKFVYFS